MRRRRHRDDVQRTTCLTRLLLVRAVFLGSPFPVRPHAAYGLDRDGHGPRCVRRQTTAAAGLRESRDSATAANEAGAARPGRSGRTGTAPSLPARGHRRGGALCGPRASGRAARERIRLASRVCRGHRAARQHPDLVHVHSYSWRTASPLRRHSSCSRYAWRKALRARASSDSTAASDSPSCAASSWPLSRSRYLTVSTC
jgi:hypothetical protein